ncbi:MAG: hypothetical protein IK100_02270 [Muribaculaceae bacterium]|nr:hypothetical protein [Muribaculaceae bacterium]
MKKVLLILVALFTTTTVWATDPIVLQMGENEGFEFSGGVTTLSFTPEETDYYVFTTFSSVPHGFCINVWTDSLYEILSEAAPFPGAHALNLGYPQKLIAGQTYRLGIYPQQSDVTTQAYVFVRKGYLVSTDAESEDLNHLLSPLPVAAYEGEEVKLNAPNTVIDNLTATANGEPIDIEISSNTYDGSTTCTFVMPAADVTISGSGHLATTEVNYVDGDGTIHTANALPLTGNETAIGMEGEDRWYVASGELNYTQTLTLNGDVRLILADGAVMNIGTTSAPLSGLGIDGSYTPSTFTVYGQTLDDNTAGHLNIISDDDCIYVYGDYAQHSGNVTMNSIEGAGIVDEGSVTLNNGTLYITVDKNAIYNIGNVDILGGKLSAVSVGNYYGIYPLDGNVTLGWKNTDDEITISNLAYGSSFCTMKIVEGQAFTDGENIYDNTTPSSVLWALTNVTLRPVVPTFDINLPESFEHGTVTCDKETAAVGETVTLTVTPDQGYEIDALTVTTIDATSGAPLRANVDLTEGENGTFTFAMPAAPVTVSASFKESTPTPVEYLNIDKTKSGQRYNMMGQPVSHDYKGIVIENGQKRVIR